MKRTFTTTLMALLLCVCMVFGLTSCALFMQDDIDDAVNEATAHLNEQITALEADIAAKAAKIATLESEKAALIREKEALEAEIAALETSNGTLTAEKAALNAIVAQLEANINEKDAKIASLTAEKQALTDKVAELEDENKTLEDEKSGLEKENATLKNCLAGKHVIDTQGEISYTWSKDYSTCTATGVCVHCENEATEVANGVMGDNKITATFKNLALEVQVVHTATTYDELNTLLQSGEVVTIRLDATLENIQSLYCEYGTTAVLDMNGNDITFVAGYNLQVSFNSSLMLKGEGTITASDTFTIDCFRGTLFIEDNVTVNGDWYAIKIYGMSGIAATVIISGGTINAQGEGKNFFFSDDDASLTITGGTFSCDPSDYVDTEKYEVTENGDGAYKVSCNHKDSTHTSAIDNGDSTHFFICTVCDSIGKEKHSYEKGEECICGVKATLVSTIDELLNAFKQGGNIVLTDNITRHSDVYHEGFSSDAVLYLNGYDIMIESNGGVLASTPLTVTEGGSLTVYGDGTVTNGQYNPSIECDKGELTVRGGTFNGIVDIKNGTGMITGGTFNDGLSLHSGDLTITGGTFNSYINAYLNSTLTITGGTFNTELNMYSSDLTITGGTFYREIHVSDGTVTITGGTFFYNPREYVDQYNYIVIRNENGTWTVTKAELI